MENKTDIIWYERLDSTNNEARKLLQDACHTTVIAAVEQTAGRGQRGNVWKSGAGMNLTFSILMKAGVDGFPALPADCQFVISEAVTLGICSFLKKEGIDTRIKWPNDIYADDRKICGMLIENTLSGTLLRSCIAGIGLNVNQTCFPEDLPNPVSMSAITGRTYDLAASLESLAGEIMHYISMMESAPESLREKYLDSMYRINARHRYTDLRSGKEFTGIIRGISGDARLVVELEDGSTDSFAFKEISYHI